MKVSELEKGRYYRLHVNSEVGYSDYIFTGQRSTNDTGLTYYVAFERAVEGGIEWFASDEKGEYSISAMFPLDKYDFHYLLEELKGCQGLLNNYDSLIVTNQIKISTLQSELQKTIDSRQELINHIDNIKFILSQNKKENKPDDGNK